jgi:transcriptional regulator with XRE-family HTH domain
MNTKLVKWLTKQVEERGWTYNELGRRAGLSSGHISLVTTERQKPGYEFCVKIAQALQQPPEKVLRLAGLLPDLPGPEEDITFGELLEIMRRLSPEERLEVYHYAKYRYQRGVGTSGSNESGASGQNPAASDRASARSGM